jgi:hypothetical protein
LEIIAMKKTFVVLVLFLTTAAFAQYQGGYINSQPQPYVAPTHPAHASYAPIATGQSIMGGSSYMVGQGERPLSDFPQAPQRSLGDAARELKKQHEHVKKARFVWEN